MENPSRIKDFTYYVLNKAEYLSFMNHVIDLVKEPIEEGSPDEISMLAENGVPELGLEKEFIEAFEVDLLAMADVVDESRIAQETESLGNLDTDRDNIATYITTRVTRSKALPIKAERDAGQHLLNVIKPYIGIARSPREQETAKIRGLVLDLRKPENAPHVETLGLTNYIDQLEETNEAYDKLSKQRTQNRSINKKESATDLRVKIDSHYDTLTLRAQSFAVAQPSERGTRFVKAINQLIDETMAAHNQRMGQRKKETTGQIPDDGGSPEEI